VVLVPQRLCHANSKGDGAEAARGQSLPFSAQPVTTGFGHNMRVPGKEEPVDYTLRAASHSDRDFLYQTKSEALKPYTVATWPYSERPGA